MEWYGMVRCGVVWNGMGMFLSIFKVLKKRMFFMRDFLSVLKVQQVFIVRAFIWKRRYINAPLYFTLLILVQGLVVQSPISAKPGTVLTGSPLNNLVLVYFTYLSILFPNLLIIFVPQHVEPRLVGVRFLRLYPSISDGSYNFYYLFIKICVWKGQNFHWLPSTCESIWPRLYSQTHKSMNAKNYFVECDS